MFFHPAAAEFAQSLPYAGEEDRRAGSGGWRRPPTAATSSPRPAPSNGVSALSGYAKAVSGKSYAFSILLNESRGDAHGAQDRIVMALIDNG